jgi:hypothetical protein
MKVTDGLKEVVIVSYEGNQRSYHTMIGGAQT